MVDLKKNPPRKEYTNQHGERCIVSYQGEFYKKVYPTYSFDSEKEAKEFAKEHDLIFKRLWRSDCSK